MTTKKHLPVKEMRRHFLKFVKVIEKERKKP